VLEKIPLFRGTEEIEVGTVKQRGERGRGEEMKVLLLNLEDEKSGRILNPRSNPWSLQLASKKVASEGRTPKKRGTRTVSLSRDSREESD